MMADWTTLPNTAVGVGGLPSGTTVTALRDNPVAIAEGAAGAPRISGFAAARIGQSELPALSVTASDAFTLSLGLTATAGTLSTSSFSNVVARTIVINDYAGTIRFKASHRTTGSGASAIIDLFKNNVLVQSFTTTLLTGTQRQVDVAVSPGDTFQWRHRAVSFGDSVASALSETASNRWNEQVLYRGAL